MDTNRQKSVLRFVPCIVALMVLIYIVGATSLIVTQYKMYVAQSQRLDVLEKTVKTLKQQVEDRESESTARAVRKPVGELKPVRPRTSERVEDVPGEASSCRLTFDCVDLSPERDFVF